MTATDKVAHLQAQLKRARKEQLFCTYYSPGTFFCETSGFELETRDLPACAARAKNVTERYEAKPFGFRFQDGNGKRLSGMHYLTGRLIRFDDVPHDDDHRIMRSNMRDPDRCVVVENTNSFRYTGEFSEEDLVVDWEGIVIRRGTDGDLVAYRREFKERDL